MTSASVGHTVELFTITPRTTDPALYWENIKTCVRLSERYGCTGVLLFTGNDTYLDPWLVAQAVMRDSERLSPLVAVNPVFMHPFTVAKMISSLALMYKRKTYLNMVTGTALSYQESLGDKVAHDERYDRLTEYANVISQLLGPRGVADLQGKFYQVKELQLRPGIPSELSPGFFVAGQSEAATRSARAMGAVHMQMLGPRFEKDLAPGTTGVHFGIVVREREDDAWLAAKKHFPADPTGQALLELSMSNTDSVWKQRMQKAANLAKGAEPGFWLEPFRNFQADCPYFVGSRSDLAARIVALARAGVRSFIVDLVGQEEEFAELQAAFDAARQVLRER